MANNGLLELYNLNTAMNNTGVLAGCDLRFYTRTLVYGVTFGPTGAYAMERFNRFLGYWEDIQFSGTYHQTINTLNQFGPFLTAVEINQLWGGLNIPPEDPNPGFIFNPV